MINICQYLINIANPRPCLRVAAGRRFLFGMHLNKTCQFFFTLFIHILSIFYVFVWSVGALYSLLGLCIVSWSVPTPVYPPHSGPHGGGGGGPRRCGRKPLGGRPPLCAGLEGLGDFKLAAATMQFRKLYIHTGTKQIQRQRTEGRTSDGQQQ